MSFSRLRSPSPLKLLVSLSTHLSQSPLFSMSLRDFLSSPLSPFLSRLPYQMGGHYHASRDNLHLYSVQSGVARRLSWRVIPPKFNAKQRSVLDSIRRENLTSFRVIVTNPESHKSSGLHRYRLIDGDGARITIGLEKRIKSPAPMGWRSRWPLKVVSEPPQQL